MLRIWSVVLICPLLLLVCGMVLAHSGATGIVKERMDLMKSIADQMKAVGRMIKGEDDFDAQKVAKAAEVIVRHAEKVPEMFPEGSNDSPSEALPTIWQDWETFLQLTADMKQQASNLRTAAKKAADIDGIRPQFAAVGKTCSACHQDFRKKNESRIQRE